MNYSSSPQIQILYVTSEEYFRNIVTYSDIFAGAHSAGRLGRSLLEVGTNHKA